MNRFKFHRIVGLVFLPLLLISVLTGFFRANHKWFWKEDYKKIKTTRYEVKIQSPQIGIDSVLSIIKSSYGDSILVSEIQLKSEIGRLFYNVKIKKGLPVLIDAANGHIVSPLTPELAKEFATQYVKDGLPFKSIHEDNAYRSRKEKKQRPVYVAEYADELHTKIYIDKNNGEIEEEVDDNLQFGFWMVKWHDYDFWNAKRFNLSFVSIGLLIVGLTGFYLWIRKQFTW